MLFLPRVPIVSLKTSRPQPDFCASLFCVRAMLCLRTSMASIGAGAAGHTALFRENAAWEAWLSARSCGDSSEGFP